MILGRSVPIIGLRLVVAPFSLNLNSLTALVLRSRKVKFRLDRLASRSALNLMIIKSLPNRTFSWEYARKSIKALAHALYVHSSVLARIIWRIAVGKQPLLEKS